MRKAFPRFGSPAATRSPAGGWSDARLGDDAHRLISTIRGGTQYNERHAGMDGRHPGPRDASGYLRVNLSSGNPCRNDGIEKLLRMAKFRLNRYPRTS